MRRMRTGLLMLSLGLVVACGGTDDPADPGGQDAVTDLGPADPGPNDPGPNDPGTVDPGPIDPGPDVPLDPSVFAVRVPQERDVPQYVGGEQTGMVKAWDLDYLCRLPVGAGPALVYVQTTPERMGTMGDPTVFGVQGAWISTGGAAAVIPGAAYDYGGNHHNDFLRFDWDGTRYKVYHSSFTSVGWRACNPPDCVQILDETGQVAQDGCDTDRAIPAICVVVQNDGTVPPLVDTFEPCD